MNFTSATQDVFDLNAEIRRRLDSEPDAKEFLRNFVRKIIPVTFSARDNAAALMPKDVDYQRTVVALLKWAMLDYSLAFDEKVGAILGKKTRNPKNGWPSTLLRVQGLLLEQHGVGSPYGFVNESQARMKRAKRINGQFNLFTTEDEFRTALISALLTHHIDGSGRLWVMMGVPNEEYTGWQQLPFDVIEYLGIGGQGGLTVPVVPDGPLVSPTVKIEVKEEKENKWQKVPLILPARG
jgi:hypothetical protein